MPRAPPTPTRPSSARSRKEEPTRWTPASSPPTRATAPDVRDLALTEVHDHSLVNAELKKIATAKGISIAPQPNAEFSARLAKLKSAANFDSAYITDMQQIHDKDEKLFAQEATGGGSPEFKTFAHQTDLIVKRHIGALHGTEK